MPFQYRSITQSNPCMQPMYNQYIRDCTLMQRARRDFWKSSLRHAVLRRRRICWCDNNNGAGFGVICSPLVEE